MKNLLLFFAIGCGDKENVTLEEVKEEAQIQEIEEPAGSTPEETTEEITEEATDETTDGTSSYYNAQENDVIKTINTVSNENQTTDSINTTEEVEVFETEE